MKVREVKLMVSISHWGVYLVESVYFSHKGPCWGIVMGRYIHSRKV